MSDMPGASAPRLRAFASAPGAPRHRRTTDVLLFAISFAIVVLVLFLSESPTSADTAISTALQSLDPLIGLVWSLSYLSLLLWSVILVVTALIRPGRRGLALSSVIAGVLAVVLALAVGALKGTSPAELWQSMVTTDPTPSAVAARVAVASAVVLAIAPELTGALRKVGDIILLAGTLSAVALGLSYPTGALAGLAVGALAATIVRLVRGSTAGLLTPDQIAWGLAELSFPVDDVGPPLIELSGAQAASARAADGRSCLIKVYGRDSQQADVAGSLWTAVRRRGEKVSLSRGRDEAVEHEAMVTLLAERAGVSVLGVLTAGVSVGGDGLLVLEGPVRTLDGLGDDEVTDAILTQIMESVKALHAAGISHGGVTDHSFVERSDGTWAITDLEEGRVGLDEDDAGVDTARLLVVTALAAGVDRSSRLALEVLGAEKVTTALPYLQSIVLNRQQRGQLKQSPVSIDEISASLASAAGTEVPKRIELRRVTPARMIWTAIGIVLAAALIGLVAQVDWQEVISALADANYAILAAALVLSLFIQVFFAVAEMGSVTVRLKYFPVLIFEYAVGFIQVVIPSTAAKLALWARFLQQFGLAPGRSVAASAIASFIGLLVQFVLIIAILLLPVPGFTTQPTTSTDSSTTDTSSTTSSWSLMGLIVLIAAFFLVGVLIALAIPKSRRRVIERVRQGVTLLREQAHEMYSALDVLRRPSNILRMVGGNLGAQLVQAGVLGVCMLAFGESATWSQLILINTAAALLNGLAPVPGGIGVVEATLTLGLTAIGVPSTTALSIALAYRAITFYLPPLWGAPAMGWLRRRQYI